MYAGSPKRLLEILNQICNTTSWKIKYKYKNTVSKKNGSDRKLYNTPYEPQQILETPVTKNRLSLFGQSMDDRWHGNPNTGSQKGSQD